LLVLGGFAGLRPSNACVNAHASYIIYMQVCI
jgi:hypothetical protein